MSKILKNPGAAAVSVLDVGVTISAGAQYTIPQQDYLLWAASSNVVTHVGSGALVVNDGSSDLSISDGVDLIKGLSTREMQLVGADGVTKASVVLDGGVGYLQSQHLVTIEELLGFDNVADTWFKINTTGADTSTWTVSIPDDGVSVVTTVTATEAGNPIKLSEKIVLALNSDVTFALKWRARKVKDNAIVWISSLFVGEVGERSDAGDFAVTVTGGTLTLGYDKIVRKAKTASLSRDTNDPRIAFLGISGRVEVTPGGIGDLYMEYALNGAASDLRVNGSVTPVVFTLPIRSDKDIFVQALRLAGNANGIKFGQFLSSNASLTNGILIEIRSDNQVFAFPAMKTTDDIKHWFTFQGALDLDVQAGRDDFMATFGFLQPFPLRKVGTFGAGNDDYVRVSIRDNILGVTSILDLRFMGFGFEKDPF